MNEPGTIQTADWTPQQNLAQAVEHVFRLGEGAADWYKSRLKSKKRAAQSCRFGAILLVAVAGTLPIVTQIRQNADGFTIAPGWASIAIAIAGLLVGLDKFFGYSSSWMRFISAEMRIRHLLEDAQLAWSAQFATWEAGTPSAEQVRSGFAELAALLKQIHSIVLEETNSWISEFQSALEQIDKQTKATADAVRLGALTIEIDNGDQVEDEWALSVDGGGIQNGRGKSAAITGLAPGLHRVRIQGTVGGRDCRDEKVVETAAGGVAALTLHLA